MRICAGTHCADKRQSAPLNAATASQWLIWGLSARLKAARRLPPQMPAQHGPGSTIFNANDGMLVRQTLQSLHCARNRASTGGTGARKPAGTGLKELAPSPACGVQTLKSASSQTVRLSSGLIETIVAGPKIVAKARSLASRPLAMRTSSSSGAMRVASNITQRWPR